MQPVRLLKGKAPLQVFSRRPAAKLNKVESLGMKKINKVCCLIGKQTKQKIKIASLRCTLRERGRVHHHRALRPIDSAPDDPLPHRPIQSPG